MVSNVESALKDIARSLKGIQEDLHAIKRQFVKEEIRNTIPDKLIFFDAKYLKDLNRYCTESIVKTGAVSIFDIKHLINKHKEIEDRDLEYGWHSVPVTMQVNEEEYSINLSTAERI